MLIGCGAAISSATKSLADQAPVRGDCLVGKGPGISPDGTPCQPSVPTHTEAEQQLIDARSEKAAAYALYKAGKMSKADFDQIAAKVWSLSGESNVEPSINQISRNLGKDPSVGIAETATTLGQLSNYWPFEQYYNWQCGPASAQSILWYKGPHTSQYASDGSTITSDRLNDQWILGYDYYTHANNGWPPAYEQQTAWSPQILDQTLNRWRVGFDTGYYLTGSVASTGGDMNNFSQSDVMARIEDDIDFNYPLAENVGYGSNSYRPSAFPGPSNWQHWDTVYGYYDSAGTRYVQIGQVWGATRFYDVAWNTHWSAIGNYGHGIVY